MHEAPSGHMWVCVPFTDAEYTVVQGYARGLAPLQDAVSEAALAYIRELEGVKLVLTRLKGSPPTRAEILAGFAAVEAPSARWGAS